ncbi:MAG: type 4a pilus biogenesis protein PilO [Bacteriovoracaceae bacterium]|nr:type 4a pilus biogenesis protein PilO [Bacteriovoracaceae bacterium]
MTLKDLFTKKLHLVVLVVILYNLYSDYSLYQEKKQAIIGQKPVLESRLKELEEKNKKVKIFQENLAASQQRVEEVTAQIEQVQRQLPNTISDTEILQLFSREAAELKIKDITQESFREEVRGFYAAKKYKFQGNGTYLQFMIFFENLAQSDRLFNVAYLSMKQALFQQKGRFQLVNMDSVIETFRYNQELQSQPALASPALNSNSTPEMKL